MKKKTIEEKYQKLDEISHVLQRPGRYLGSINPHTASVWLYNESTGAMVSKEATWCPALLKVFDEIISNSVDHSKTNDGKHLDTIKVTIEKDSGRITVHDNGGIPVVMHEEHQQYIPEMIYELRAGSNFNDDEEDADNQFGTGQNGEGAALTNIFATEFSVITSDGKNRFKQVHTNNSRSKTAPKVTPNDKKFTEISWIPDYARLGLNNLDEDNYQLLVKRVVDIAGCNPRLKIVLNGKHIQVKNFQDYVKMYQEEYIYDSSDKWRVAFAHSENGFEHISFVNSTMTKLGGPHVDYIAFQAINALREHFKKKHKVDVKPADIKAHFRLFIDCEIVKPRYDSQTKENLITEVRNFGTEFTLSDKAIRNLIKSPIIQSVLDWVEAKAKANEMAELRKLNKTANKTDPKRVEKFTDANEKRDRHLCELYLAEGDSARTSIQSARGKNPYIGSFSLRGKPLNVMDAELSDIIANNEIKSILTITGLELGKKVEMDPDKKWIHLEIDGKKVIVNEADEIFYKDQWISVKSLL